MIGSHRAPSRQIRLSAALTALVLVAGAAFFVGRVTAPTGTVALPAAPVDLQVPLLFGDQLHDWCVARKATGTATLSSAARSWLNQCIAVSAPTASPTPSPSPSPSPSPGPSPSPTPSPTPTPTPTPSPTPTPTPSPSPTPGPLTNCLAAPSVCGWPDATNTGAKGTLTAVQGDVTLSTAGQVYADKDVTGCISVTAPNVVIRNVRVNCPTQFTWGIEYNGQGGGTLTVEDTTILCVPTASALGNNHFVARRVDVSGCDNGFMIYNGDVVIVDSWCHDLTDQALHPEAHTDCVEGTEVNDVTIRHNTLNPGPGKDITSALGACCLTPELAGSVRVRWVADNNLLDGGASSIYCGRFAQVGSLVTNNRFGNHQFFGPSPGDSCINPDITWTGNVWDATNVSVPAA